MEELLGLLKKLALPSNIELDNSSKQEFYRQFEKIYVEDFRHSYSEISVAMEEFCPEERDQVVENIKELSHLQNISNTFQKKIHKLYDHVSLEVVRLNRMAKVEYYSNMVDVQKENIENLYNELNKNVKSLNKRVNHSLGQIVAILGIFTGIVLSCVFAFQFFQGALSGLKDNNLHQLLLLSIVVGFAVFNIVFMLMFVVAKLAGMTIAVDYSYPKAYRRNAINTLRRKYPYVFYFDFFMIVCALIIYFFKCRT